MKHTTYKNKRIIWKSKTKEILAILLSFLFVAIAIWTEDKTTALIFWGTVFLFGGGGLIMLIRLINTKNIFVTHNSEKGRQILAEQFQNVQEDLGSFDYNNTGFNLTEYKGISHFDWPDIETVFGFKQDYLTTDEISMDIFFSNEKSIRLTESIPGWHQFNKQLCKQIPTIPESWDSEIAHPPYATNMTLLFDKHGRTKEEAEKSCYNS